MGNYIVLNMAVTYYNVPFIGLVRGWRIGWIAVGGISIVAAVLCSLLFPSELKERRVTGTIIQMMGEEVGVIFEFMTMPTFIFMIMQGFFGTIPWTVMWVMNRYYLYGGSMSRNETAIVTSLNPVWGVLGTLLGGYVSDFLAGRFGEHGRPLNAQLTVALGVPLMYMNFIGIYPDQGGFVLYLGINFAFGLVASWAQGGTNFPILSQIVPEAKRSRVLAVEGALENSCAMIAGSNLVPLVSRAVFGFDLDSIPDQQGTNVPAARAIGYSLGLSTCVPWLLAYVIYSILHYSYPRDLRRLERELGERPPPKQASFAVGQYSVSMDQLPVN